MADADGRSKRRAVRRVTNADFTVARVHLWGQLVGAVAEDAAGNITFEYDEAFRRSGLEVSPIHLPLMESRGPMQFPALRRSTTFAGLPGLLADSLPDAFGNAVITRYFAEHGNPQGALSPVQKLLYIGSRAMGALEFTPALQRLPGKGTTVALEVAQLVEQARRVIADDPEVAIPEMMQVGSSAGGARAKALLLWNRATNQVKSGFASRVAGDEHWMIKFDGVSGGNGGHGLTQAFAPGPWGRTEFAYAQMARAAGISMTDTHLFFDRDFAHFMTKRFDRDGDARLHLHSLGGLRHSDYNVPRELSYEDYFRTILRLGMGQPEIAQAFARMAFNVVARNQDDHVKNFAFLMAPDGQWRLAPAYDMIFAYGSEWTRFHQMTVNGKMDAFTRDDLLTVGHMFDLPSGGAQVLAQVEDAVALWPSAAAAVGLSRDWIESVQAQFRRLG